MITIKSFEFGPLNLEVKREDNSSNTRFTKYYLFNDNKPVMTAFYYKKVSDYFDMLVEEHLKKVG